MAALLLGEGGSSTKSSKLAAVLRKLHNANDMLHLSAYETGKPNSPNTEETSVPQSSPTDNFDSNDDSQRDSVGQLSDVHKECNMADVGRETTSQECLVAKGQASDRVGSSRRKQQKTRKVVEMVDDTLLSVPEDSSEQYMDADLTEYSSSQSVVQEQNSLSSEQQMLQKPAELQPLKVSPSQSADVADKVDLPEGTVFVQPESVDFSPAFQELETSRAKSKFKGNLDTAIINCSACHRQIGSDSGSAVHRHPVLKVLICKKCYTLYNNTNIEQDVDGSDEQCRWCGQGGDLICCDFCHNAICKTCIRRNLGRKELSNILNAGDNERWRCYVCDPKPLLGLIEHCSAVMEALARQEKLESEKRRKPDPSSKLVTGTQYNSSSVKTATGLKQAAQPVSVIQTASMITIAKSRMQPSVDAGKQQSLKVAGRTVASLLSDQQQLSRTTTKTVASLLAEQKVKPGMTPPASSQVQVTSSAPRAVRPLHPHVQNVVTSHNVLVVLDRLQSATNSMNVFLQSLRMDARKNAVGNTSAHFEKRREIAGKLTRAYAAYTRSFQEVTAHTAPSPNAAAASQMARVNSTKPQQGTVVMRAPPATNSAAVSAASRPANNARSVLSRPPVKSTSSEVIEISDSEDERGSAGVEKSKSQQQLTNQTNVGIPVVVGKISESRLTTAGPLKVTGHNMANIKKRAQSPDSASSHPATSHTAAKHVCLDGNSEPTSKPQVVSGEDGVMFDGGVEEIPHDDVTESSDDHHLQMYCVEVNEDSDDSDTPLSDIQVTNGRLPVVSATVASRQPAGKLVKPRSLLEAELTRNINTSRSVVS